MTDAQGPGPNAPPQPSTGPKATRGRRLRFAAALLVFAAWVAGLALLAIRSDPPPPLSTEERAAGPDGSAPDPREG